MWRTDIVVSRFRKIGDAPPGTGVNEKWQHIRCNSHRNPTLQRRRVPERASTKAALLRNEAGMNLGQLGKGGPMLEIPVECPRADSASLQLLAPGDFEWKPMKAVGSVWGELLQGSHLSDLRRNSNQAAPIEDQMIHGFQLCDALREFGNLRPLTRVHLRPR
jgi:hypothetical protein